MINKEELDRITLWIKENVALNDEYMWGRSEYIVEVPAKCHILPAEVIFSLHNLLYECVTGSSYDYWFHWTNKIGINGFEENLFTDKRVQDN